ncbi:MAG: hypothetical protein K9N49_00265 [Candidatus Marinimicrobia bacterium]|nr:hypothetical protein [Candidatus Neomarinimicrobiota bacterium]
MSPFWSKVLGRKRLKLLALGLATISWYAIQGTINAEREITDIALQIETEDGWAVLDSSETTVDVTFRGAQDDLLRLHRDQVRVLVDARRMTAAGAQMVTLRPSDVRAATAARVVRLRPAQISLMLDRKIEKLVPVKAEFSGLPEPGFALERFECTPAIVQLSGPEASLREVDHLRLTPITLDGRIRSFRSRENVVLPPDAIDATVDPNRISVEVKIIERSARRLIADVPVRLLTSPQEAQRIGLRPLRVTVEVMGQPEQLETLQSNEVTAFVEFSDLPTGQYQLPVRVTLPSGLRATAITPPVAEVLLDPPPPNGAPPEGTGANNHLNEESEGTP